MSCCVSELLLLIQEEQNNRATYWQIPQAQYYSRWKGLAAGATAESVALHAGRPIMRPVVLLGRDTYARSIARFTAGLKGKFKALAEARAAPAVFHKHSQPAQMAQASHLPASSAVGVPSGIPTAATSSSGLARPALPYSSAQAGAHGSLAAGTVAASHGTASGQNVATVPAAAARPVPVSYGMIPPAAASYPARPVQHHL